MEYKSLARFEIFGVTDSTDDTTRFTPTGFEFQSDPELKLFKRLTKGAALMAAGLASGGADVLPVVLPSILETIKGIAEKSHEVIDLEQIFSMLGELGLKVIKMDGSELSPEEGFVPKSAFEGEANAEFDEPAVPVDQAFENMKF